MAQSTILAPGTTDAVSTDVVVATGVKVHVGAFGAAATYLPYGYAMVVRMDTPNGDIVYSKITPDKMYVHITGPGTFRVYRPAIVGSAFGVFLET